MGTGRRPLVLGHRGASAVETENTMDAFLRAIDDGADGIELDVRLCSSGEVIVFHDDTLDRLAGLEGSISELSWTQLREVSLRGGTEIPLLSDVLLAVPGWINVEVKPPPWRQIAAWCRAVAAVIDASGVAGRIRVSSFHPGVLSWFRALRPRLETGLLFHAGQSSWLRTAGPARLLRPTALHAEHVLLSEATVKRWLHRGYSIAAWTVDDPARAVRLARLGVSAIISNTPAAIAAALDRAAQ